MDTTRLKRFAQEARNILLTGVAQRLSTLGINRDGMAERPQVMGGGATFQGKTVSLDFVNAWVSIAHNVETRGYRVVVEEAAYTWFNRLVAIRIMAKNSLIEPLLQYESETVHIPFIVTEARHGRLPQFTDEQQAQWNAIANDDSKTDDQFMLLIAAWCDNNPIINAAFGSLDDYSSMLIPSNILKDDGFVDKLNQTDYISDDDYRSPELIGWLYQFYISERKDEVFAKKGKYDSDEIPAATQIFTPNWIVKYMVQNTLGRIYLDANPWENELQKGWKYLVDTPEGYDERKNTQMLELENLRTGDLACGSGHILNEQFSILYSMYLNDGYSPRNAIESIFRKNIVGIDIDLRAKQLATFSLLLKSCQIDKSLVSNPVVPRVYSMPHIEAIPNLEYPNPKIKEEVEVCFKLMLNAETLGSIMKFEISDATRQWIQSQAECGDSMSFITNCYNIILALTERYDALAMNPPYMGGGNMPEILSDYVKTYYSEGRSDMMTVFMQLSMNLCKENGYWAEINLPSWMFLPSFYELRDLLISNQYIYSLIHLGRGIFGSDFGSVSFIIRNCKSVSNGNYRKLIKAQGKVQSIPELESLFLNKKIGSYTANQNNFPLIPGSPIAFWVSEHFIHEFNSNKKVRDIGEAKKGLSTGDNNTFLRFWFEPSLALLNFESNTFDVGSKWFPINKGGNYRKWYGNNEYVINWKNHGEDIKSFAGSVIRNEPYYLRESLTWTMLSASCFGIRYSKRGKLFEGAGPSLFIDNYDEMLYVLGVLGSAVGNMVIRILNPTVNININDVLNVPIKFADTENVVKVVSECITISKADWDAHETSWDFAKSEILQVKDEIVKGEWIEECVRAYKQKWERMFTQLHRNEEELNRRFIEIYGLQDELDFHVPFDEITILQQGEINHNKTMPVYTVGPDGEEEVGYKLHWNDDVVIKQLISYAMGCIMGRYSIDKPGLILANQGDGVEEYYEIVGDSRFEVDDDGIVPLMAANLELTDNAPLRFKKWLEAAFGTEHLVENLNYVQQALGKTIEAYFQKDFWKDHKKMYQNRPIYWLFTSKKGAFQCLVYMHRMDAYTPERIRTRYLLPHIDWLKRRQDELQQRASSLNTTERRDLDNIARQIEECLEYHDRLHVIADAQQAIDLDDGVVVNYAKFGDVVAKLK